MPHRPESVPPLRPEEIAAILGDPQGDRDFEARSRRDTRLANELFDRLREVRGIVAATPLPPTEGERARAALDDFERALFDLLRYHGT
jgi:hypothetical protein